MYDCVAVPASVQKSTLELFYDSSRDQCIWKSYEPRYASQQNPLLEYLAHLIQSCSGFNAGTREAAFVHALSSAAVAVAVTRACTRGELERCGCDRKVKGVSPEGKIDFIALACTGQTHTKTLSAVTSHYRRT